ncbi:MAG: extracellular solute-binding protein [Lachnospiraceae bacterium]
MNTVRFFNSGTIFKIKYLLLLVLGGLLLSGCGTTKSALNPKDPVSIVVWHYYNGTQKSAFDNLVREFNDTVGTEQGIIVSTQSKGDVIDLAAAVTDSAQSKVGSDELPDIFATYVDTAYLLYEQNLLVNLKDYITQEELNDYIPDFLAEGMLKKDELYVMPVAKSTELLYLNETDWAPFAAETGANSSSFSTWEELAQVAEQYYNWSGGKAFFGRDAFANYLIVGSHQMESDIFKASSSGVTIQLKDDVMKRLWDCYCVPYLKGYYGAYGRFRSDDVKTGDLIACVGSTSSIAYYPQKVISADGSSRPITSKAYALPDFKDTKECSVQQGAGMAVLKSDVSHETASAVFLKWFTDVTQNTKFCSESGYFPVKLEAGTSKNMENAYANIEHVSDLVLENALLGVEAITSQELYTNPPFDNGSKYRGILTSYMTDWLDTHKPSLEGLTSDEVNLALENLFTQWLSGLKHDLQ